jgi:hypothetical protein
MPAKSFEERLLAIAYNPYNSSTTLSPGPGRKPTSAKTALRRCCAAWQRSYDAYLASIKRPDDGDRTLATIGAGESYRNAMPLLTGYEGIRDFIACTAHGILIGAIPAEISGRLIYAAQIALNSLPHDPELKQLKQLKKPLNEPKSPLSTSQTALPLQHDSQSTHMQ